jgi:hypothetical protein
MNCLNYIELEFADNSIFTLPSTRFKKKIYVSGVTPSIVAEGDNLKYVGGYFRKNNNFRILLDVKTLGYANLDKDSACCESCQDYGDYLELCNLIKNYKYMRILTAHLPRLNATPTQAITTTSVNPYIKIPMPVVIEGGGLPKLSNNWSYGIEDLNFNLIELTPTSTGV